MYYTNTVCHKANGWVGGVEGYDDFLCAGGEHGKDACQVKYIIQLDLPPTSSIQGDSGGPLMYRTSGKSVLAGLVSHGVDCGQIKKVSHWSI